MQKNINAIPISKLNLKNRFNYQETGEIRLANALKMYMDIREIDIDSFEKKNNLKQGVVKKVIAQDYDNISVKSFFNLLSAIGADESIPTLIPSHYFKIDKELITTEDSKEKLLKR